MSRSAQATEATARDRANKPMKTARDMEYADDPELAAAYADENEKVRFDIQAWVVAVLFGVVPLGIVLFLLSFWLGDRVWRALPPLWIALIVVQALVWSGLIRRYRSDLPTELPGVGTLRGPRKKRLVLKAMAALAAMVVADILFERYFYALRDWLLGCSAGRCRCSSRRRSG